MLFRTMQLYHIFETLHGTMSPEMIYIVSGIVVYNIVYPDRNSTYLDKEYSNRVVVSTQ